MLVSDMMVPDGRVYMKSEFGPTSNDWPCFSFTRKSLGVRLQADFKPGRDIIIYVGTTNPNTTEDPDHRSRLISAVSIEPNRILETSKIIPTQMWEWSKAVWGEKWEHSRVILDAALLVGPPYPEARRIAPKAYAAFAEIQNRGNIVEPVGEERHAIMALPKERVALTLSEPVQRYMNLMRSARVSDKIIKQEAYRMASNILDRVVKGGTVSSRINLQRSSPNISELIAIITRKWQEDQKGKCALCGGPLVQSKIKSLQPSVDRIDSGNVSYSDENMQITHLACNLAKNEWGLSDFTDWLAIVQVRDIEIQG